MYIDHCEQWGFPGAASDWEDPLKEGTATHSSVLAWEIPWTEEPDWPQSMGPQREGHD